MTWLLIDAENQIVSTFEDDEAPPPVDETAGERIERAPLTYPDGMGWDPELGGFYPIPTDDEWFAMIDAAAGEARCKYITVAPGQDMTYQRKEKDARAWVAAVDPSLSDFPFIAAESGATGQTPAEAADTIIAAADQWATVGSAIEGLRIGAKVAVASAADFAAKRAIVEGITWP